MPAIGPTTTTTSTTTRTEEWTHNLSRSSQQIRILILGWSFQDIKIYIHTYTPSLGYSQLHIHVCCIIEILKQLDWFISLFLALIFFSLNWHLAKVRVVATLKAWRLKSGPSLVLIFSHIYIYKCSQATKWDTEEEEEEENVNKH